MKYVNKLSRYFACGLLLCGGGYTVAAEERYVMISHGVDSDPYWNVVKNAVKEFSEDFNVPVDYRTPHNGDLSGMKSIIEQSAARNYSGVATTIIDFNILKSSIEKVKNKNIPLVTFDAGTLEQSKSLGAITHLEQDEYLGAKYAAEEAKKSGVKSFLCVNHEITNQSLFRRCKGFAEVLNVDLNKSMLDVGADPVSIEAKVSAYLRNNQNIDAVLALGPLGAIPTIRALNKIKTEKKVWVASFDLSPEIIDAIKKKQLFLAIDAQPYLMGYLSLAILYIYNHNKSADLNFVISSIKSNEKFKKRIESYSLTPIYEDNFIKTGPGFVTIKNVNLVDKLAGTHR